MKEEFAQTNVSGVVFWKEIHERMTVFQTIVLGENTFEEGIPFTDLFSVQSTIVLYEARGKFQGLGF